MPNSSRPLTRASHNKSRKGCLTCKQRHVKCDETQPACLACQRVRKTCEGYPDEKDLQFRWRRKGSTDFIFKNTFGPQPKTAAASSSSQKSSSSPDGVVALVRLPPPSPLAIVRRQALPPAEARAWEYFSHKTVPLLGSFFASKFWSQSVPSVSQAAPAIKHTLLAIGAWHAEEDRRIAQSSGLMIMAPNQDTFAAKQYGKALQALAASMASGVQDNASRTVALFACLLFVVFESLRGQSAQVRLHLRHGLQMCREGIQNQASAPDRALIELMLARLGISNAMFDNNPALLAGPDALSLLDVPERSGDLPQMQLLAARIHNISNDVYRFVWKVGNAAFADDAAKHADMARIKSRVDDWLATIQASGTDTATHPGTKILWARYELARTMLQTSSNLYQTNYDLYMPTFVRIIDLIRSVLQPNEPSSSPGTAQAFSVDSGIIPVLAYTARLCRHPQLRRTAVELLHRCPRREGLWSAPVAIASCNIVIEFEEQAALGVDDSGVAIIPEEARVHLVRHHNMTSTYGELGDSLVLDLILTLRPDPSQLDLSSIPRPGVVVADHQAVAPMTLM